MRVCPLSLHCLNDSLGMRVNSGTPNGCGYDWQLPVLSLQTEKDANSLFHAASLGFWGVHDRTSLLFQAVFHTLSDPKAQFLIYDRWSDEMARSMPAGSKPVSSSSLIMHTSLCLEYAYTLHLRLTGTIGFIYSGMYIIRHSDLTGLVCYFHAAVRCVVVCLLLL